MERAILIAAGKGERMRPITNEIPKPLVKVHGVPMIETVIGGLKARGVDEIIVVVGYLSEKFSYLPEKYDGLKLIENTEYTVKNNISSIHAALDYMGDCDTFVCEADLYVSDPSIFDSELEGSCYYGKLVPGHSEDWVLDLDANGHICRIGTCGDNAYNMVGVSYFKAADAKLIGEAVKATYEREGHEKLYWDEVVGEKLAELGLTVHPVEIGQIVEIDSVAELAVVDPSYAGIV